MAFLRCTMPLGALIALLLVSPGIAQEPSPQEAGSNRPRIDERLDTDLESEETEPSTNETEEESPHERRPLLILFLSLVGVGLALFVAERTRAWITVNVPIRRAMGALIMLLRLTGLGLVLAIALQLLPAGRDWFLYGLVILAIVTGWSVRDLFADVVAGIVLASERRVKKGMWVSGNGFQGTVEGRSLRATWLRDGQGHRLTVPNRAMVGAPMVYDSGAEAEHEVVVRLEGYHDASQVRLALNDAILSSPWVLAGATPVVLRDPADPVVWRVRSKLLEPRFSVHFEGELLERVEDLLRYEPVTDERETLPTDPEDTTSQ
ncbi:MAG: mechanosensitive ion channel family protein [Myxococcales bacterium]|nr:mechanosensitive ion channel family protein [Myxococcales bacterium]MDH3483510.1 mechanosensitive ion channel family protein [Myxococcales bacterium]